MTSYESDLLRVLDERGYIHQMTDATGLDALSGLTPRRLRSTSALWCRS
jgi:hypothetical protein